MRGSFGHAPGFAGGAHATALAGVGDQEIVLALIAVRSGESMRKDAAFEIAAEGSLDMGGGCFTILAAGELQPGFEVGLICQAMFSFACVFNFEYIEYIKL